MSGVSPKSTVEFPPYELDLVSHELRCDGRQVRLRTKDFFVLQYLVEHSDRAVTKHELFQAVWPDVAAPGAVLKMSIRSLRKALGDTVRPHVMIRTVRGVGYRFLVPALHNGQRHPVNFVGREDELSYLSDRLQSALARKRQVLLLCGEPGIGKTSLVDRFIERISQPEIYVARGQCIESYGSGEAYHPLLAILQDWYRREGEQLVAVLNQHAPSWLAQLPSLVSIADHAQLSARVQRASQDRMVREICQALDILAQQRGVVLILEDLHWSDTSTLDVIASLASRSHPAKLMVLGTYRPQQVRTQDSSLQALVHDLQRSGHTQPYTLPRLTEEAVVRYLRQRFLHNTFPQTLAQAVYERTNGNPLFLVKMLDALVEQGKLVRQESSWTLAESLDTVLSDIPSEVRQFIMRQFVRLTSYEQEVLAVASVVGMTFLTITVSAALDDAAVDVEQCCERLMRGEHFVQQAGETQWTDGTLTSRYQFVHPLYREVVYASVPPLLRQQLHLRIGVYEEAGHGEQSRTIAAELAVHFEQGRDYTKAVQYRIFAAENALKQSASREAFAHAVQGRRLLELLPETADRALQEVLILQTYVSEGIPQGLPAPDLEHAFQRACALVAREDLPPSLAFSGCSCHLCLCQSAIHRRAAVRRAVFELGQSREVSRLPQCQCLCYCCQGLVTC